MDQNSQNVVWIDNSRTACPTYILMLFLSFLYNLLYWYIRPIFQKVVDNFEIEHKTCSFWVEGTVPLNNNLAQINRFCSESGRFLMLHWKPQVNHLTHLAIVCHYTDKKTHFSHIFESFCPCTDPLWLKWVKWFTRVFLCLSRILSKISPKMKNLGQSGPKQLCFFYSSSPLNLRLKVFTKLHNSIHQNTKFSRWGGGHISLTHPLHVQERSWC